MESGAPFEKNLKNEIAGGGYSTYRYCECGRRGDTSPHTFFVVFNVLEKDEEEAKEEAHRTNKSKRAEEQQLKAVIIIVEGIKLTKRLVETL